MKIRNTLGILILLVLAGSSFNQEEPLPLKVGPEPPPEALPEVCKGYQRPVYKDEPLSDDDFAVIGERADRMISGSGECLAFSMINSQRFQEEHLWLRGADGVSKPNGGGGNCDSPFTADVVKCHASINDQDWNVVERVEYTCRGDRVCVTNTDSSQCCKVTKRTKVFEKYEPPSAELSAQWEKERCDRLEQRKATCQPFCTQARYVSECASYWGVTCGNGA